MKCVQNPFMKLVRAIKLLTELSRGWYNYIVMVCAICCEKTFFCFVLELLHMKPSASIYQPSKDRLLMRMEECNL